MRSKVNSVIVVYNRATYDFLSALSVQTFGWQLIM